MTAPLFSVVMPTHYRPDIVGLAIESVLNQTEPDFELLVVGDGAQPGTAEAVLESGDNRIRWFDLPKAPGFGYANRNKVLAESQGELIAYAADDDLMFPDHLETLAAPFARGSVQWAYSQALWVSSDGIAAPELTNLTIADEREYFGYRNSISGGSAVYRASAFPTRSVWPEHLGWQGDWDIFRRLLSQYGPEALQVLPTPTYFHFTARRKAGHRDSAFPLLNGWLQVADSADWWPDALRADAPAGTPLQEVYAARLLWPGYVAQVRQAATTVINKVALRALEKRVVPPPGG